MHTVSKFFAKLCILPNKNLQNCVEITNQVEYLIKQKPRGALAEKQKGHIEEVGSSNLVFFQAIC